MNRILTLIGSLLLSVTLQAHAGAFDSDLLG